MKELEMFTFRKHPMGFQAVAQFDNKFALSVLPERDGESYEVAVLRNGSYCGDSGVIEDVERYRTVDEVYELATKVRNLKEGTRVVR
jgi:hypothetical protein